MSRRALMGSAVAVSTLSACSVSGNATTTRDLPDQDLLKQARDLSLALLNEVETITARQPQTAQRMSGFQALHAEQIAQFAKAAKTPAVIAAPSRSSAAVSTKTLMTNERHLAGELRGLALKANRGDVAALLASAAAGIDQSLVGLR